MLSPPPFRRRAEVSALACGAVVLALGACGGPAPSEKADPAGGPQPEPSPSSGIGDLGITEAEWPETLDDARTMMASLPSEFRGMQLDLDDDNAVDVTATYQVDGNTVVHIEARQGLPQEEDAAAAAPFGASYRFYQYFRGAVSRPYCQPRSFTGTAPSFENRGRDPDPAFDIDIAGDFYWFSCVVGESPDPTVGMATLGWASGSLSWFATSPDHELLAEVLDLLATGGESA